jgi:hypothetical protein
MSPKEYNAILDRHGLTQSWIGETLAQQAGTGRKWAAGVNRIPKSAAIVLLALDSGLLSIDEIGKLAIGLRPKRK